MNSIRLSALMILLFPLAAVSGDMIYREGTLIQGPVRAEDSWVGKATPTGVKAKNWVFVVKVGDYTFTGHVDHVGGNVAAKGPKADEWPASATLEVVFHTREGSLYMDLRSPSGKKQEDLWVFSKKGADGKELCGKIKCKQTAEDSADTED